MTSPLMTTSLLLSRPNGLRTWPPSKRLRPNILKSWKKTLRQRARNDLRLIVRLLSSKRKAGSDSVDETFEHSLNEKLSNLHALEGTPFPRCGRSVRIFSGD